MLSSMTTISSLTCASVQNRVQISQSTVQSVSPESRFYTYPIAGPAGDETKTACMQLCVGGPWDPKKERGMGVSVM